MQEGTGLNRTIVDVRFDAVQRTLMNKPTNVKCPNHSSLWGNMVNKAVNYAP